MTFNHDKLRGRMRELRFSQDALAKEIGISGVALSKKLNNRTEFTAKEMLSIMKLLDIVDPVPYFFTPDIAKTQ